MLWSEEEDRLILRLWNLGATASEISDQLPNRSRNAVLGRIHRLNAPPRPSPIKPSIKKTKDALLGKRYKGKGISMIELKSDTCRWPLWAVGDKVKNYCGAKCIISYCPEHCETSYETKKWKKIYEQSVS